MSIRRVFTLALTSLLLALASPALAQNYPSRPITMIVPFAPGGPADVLGRLIGQKMSEDLGQQVVIDNRSGANTIVGAQFVAHAPADGYTIMLAIDCTLVMNPFLYTKLAYDPFKDFAPVSLVALVPSALTASIKNPANTLKEVIDIEKAKPGTFQVGVSTPTSQVAIGLLNMMAGTNMVIVPYRGGTTQITSMMAGDIPLGHESVNVALPLYRDRKIKIIALTGQKRLSLAPELPLIAETFPGFDLGIWQSVVVPTGTPKPIVDRLFASLQKAMAAPDLREKLSTAGIEPTISRSPEEFGAFIKSQAEVREKVIKAVGMKID
jgi:tripartite-type tricarboxylate transporter receptor subunit TctC